MKKRFAWPDGHWDWPIKVTHKHGVRCGQMIWVGGQVASFSRVLAELGSGLPDVVKLFCFYVNDGSVDEARYLSEVARCLPPGARPAVSAIPVPYLAYPGMLVEIEGYAMRGENDEKLSRQILTASGLSPLPTPFVQGRLSH